MSMVFHAKFLETLRHLSTTEALARSAPLPALGTPRDFSQLLDHLSDKDWVVYTKPTCPGPGHVLDYLGRYTHRVAIAHHRLVAVDNGQVSLTYRHRRQEHQQQIMTLTAHECRSVKIFKRTIFSKLTAQSLPDLILNFNLLWPILITNIRSRDRGEQRDGLEKTAGVCHQFSRPRTPAAE
jgi:hypothetical protein